MNNKKRDVKFIIYQSLYIFVVCVIFIKGADLGLTEVIDLKHGWAYVDTINNVIIDKVKFSQMMVIDTNYFVVIPKELLKENEKLQQIVENMPKNQNPYIDLSLYVRKSDNKEWEDKTQEVDQKGEIIVGDLDLVQYRDNPIPNIGNAPITIKGITIAPHTTKSIPIGGENSVLFTSGNISKTFPTRENQKPKLSLQSMVPLSGDEIHLSKIQSVVGYRVTISDDFAGQLDVKITGSVTYKIMKQTDKEIIIDVTLNAFPSKSSFDNFTDIHSQDRYSSTFNVTVKDRIAPHSMAQVGIFYYTEW